MAEQEKPLLIKRYASRRLYNTETSDYVTLGRYRRVYSRWARGSDRGSEIRAMT